jgi:hypothetical protein
MAAELERRDGDMEWDDIGRRGRRLSTNRHVFDSGVYAGRSGPRVRVGDGGVAVVTAEFQVYRAQIERLIN